MPFAPVIRDDLPPDLTQSGWMVVAGAPLLGSIRPRVDAGLRGADTMSALLGGWFFDPRGFPTCVRHERLGLTAPPR